MRRKRSRLFSPAPDISAVTIPRPHVGLGIDRAAVAVDLEVQMAGGRPRVAGPADVADDLADVDQIAPFERRRADHVGVPVLPPLPQPPDHDVVAIETRVVGALDDRAGGGRGEWSATPRGDVEALVAG